MMGVDELHYYDLYAPLVGSVESRSTRRRRRSSTSSPRWRRSAPNTSAVVQRAFNERWIDLFPNAGKRSGAYSNGGAYDVHPYMLINYNGKYDDMSTLAHELGHTMQSYLLEQDAALPAGRATRRSSRRWRRRSTSRCSSTTCSRRSRTIDARLSMLGNYLEGIKGTVFRQTQFAEFELRMHEMAQKGQPITGEALAKLYMDITKRYYGHDQGVCHRRRLHRPRVELHSALLSRLLRVPVRDVVHRLGGARRRRSRPATRTRQRSAT